MTPLLAQSRRGERAFERLYRRHVGDVYRYALVLLRDPDAAEEVTLTTFLIAYRLYRSGERPRNAHAWLLGMAHAICRQRVRAEFRAEDLDDDEAARAIADELGPSAVQLRRALREQQLEGTITCHEAERAISRQVDGRLPRSERGALRAHLRKCYECAGFARSPRAQRSAWRTLASVALPASLQSFFGPGGVLARAASSAGSTMPKTIES